MATRILQMSIIHQSTSQLTGQSMFMVVYSLFPGGLPTNCDSGFVRNRP